MLIWSFRRFAVKGGEGRGGEEEGGGETGLWARIYEKEREKNIYIYRTWIPFESKWARNTRSTIKSTYSPGILSERSKDIHLSHYHKSAEDEEDDKEEETTVRLKFDPNTKYGLVNA